jgi:hypothetical protein
MYNWASPELMNTKICPDGAGHQEKRNGRSEVSEVCQGIQAGSVGIAEAWGQKRK